MNLKNMTDCELHASSEIAAKNERAALSVVLEHLAEVQRRKAFSPEYHDIKSYAIGRLGYDDKSAWRRVSAMFLLMELPEIAHEIENGSLALSKIAIAQNHFRIERAKRGAKLSKSEKLETVLALKGKTTREIDRLLFERSSAPEKLRRPDQVRALAGEQNEVRVVLSDTDLNLIAELRGIFAHSHPGADVSTVIGLALEKARDAILMEKSGGSRSGRIAKPRHLRPRLEAGISSFRRAAGERDRSDAGAPAGVTTAGGQARLATKAEVATASENGLHRLASNARSGSGRTGSVSSAVRSMRSSLIIEDLLLEAVKPALLI